MNMISTFTGEDVVEYLFVHSSDFSTFKFGNCDQKIDCVVLNQSIKTEYDHIEAICP